MVGFERQSGFTLMEIVGVMAIIAILAAVLAPSLTDGIDRANAAREEGSLRVLAEALENHVLTNKAIPGQNVAEWSAAIAAYADLRQDDVIFNARGFRRGLYVDPQFFTSTETAFPGYTQSVGLGSRPYSPRLMLVSDLTRNAPAAPGTATDFAAIWDQRTGAAVMEGAKVKIARLNLGSRFHRLLLVNANVQQPAYALEGAAPISVPPAVAGMDGMLSRYVLEHSQVSLYVSPFPAGGMQTTTIISADVALHYRTDGSSWYWEPS